MVIFKYELPLSADFELDLPEGAKVVHVGLEPSMLVGLRLWALVDKNAPMKTRRFSVLGTGQEFHHEATYLGSVITSPFIWHVFENSSD